MMQVAYEKMRVEIETLKFYYVNSAVNLIAKMNGGLSKSDALFELISKIHGSDMTLQQLQLDQTKSWMERYEQTTGLRFGSPEMDKAVEETVAALEGRT